MPKLSTNLLSDLLKTHTQNNDNDKKKYEAENILRQIIHVFKHF